MTKRFILLLFCSVFIFVGTMANEVNKDTASLTAIKAIEKYVPGFSGNVQSVTPVMHEGVHAYYAVNFSPEGWVLVAADDAITPILGYSPTGHFETKNQPVNVVGWLENYADEIAKVIRLKDNVQHKGWKELDRVVSRAATDKVSPLIQVTWNQSGAYNKYCPSDADGRAVVGCVAVAMAQAMSVAQWPERPVGNYSYTSARYGNMYINYDKEPAYNWNAILSGANNKDDVARLLWHCGVAIDMDYGPDGSGTQTSYIPRALKRNFSYPESVTYYSRSGYSGDWKMLIVNELQAGRAVCYSGADLKKGYGHCFNLDGYDGNTMFHVNWGWGGQNDGYFPLDGLKDATMDMDYTAQQGVVVGIRPPSEKPSDITLSATVVKENQPAGTVVAQVSVSSEATNPDYEYKLQGTYSEILHDYIQVPFVIENGELKTTEVLKVSSRKEWTMDITATNKANKASITKTFTIKVLSAEEANYSPTTGVSLKYDKTENALTITSAEQTVDVLIYNGNDELIGEGTVELNKGIKCPLTELTTHTITIQIRNAMGSKAIKLIVNKEEE